MDEDLIIKKIYINDYIINSTLLKNSISKLLINTLSNKFYKTSNLNKKVNNLLDVIDNIFIETGNNEKIFNLAYQPYNQYNITTNYNHNSFNKKWIIPIVVEKKNLSNNMLTLYKRFNYNNNEKLLVTQENDKYFLQETEEININTNENNLYDENELKFNIENINILKSNSKQEFEVLDDSNFLNIFNIINTDNVSISKTSCKVIRKCLDKCYYMDSDESLVKITNSVSELNKTLLESKYQVHNILVSDPLNITDFLILNPFKLLHSNYNIVLGNTISYLNEIINATHFSIENIINNELDNLENSEFTLQEKNIDFKIVEKNEFTNIYNQDSYVYDYLQIIKNLKNYNNIYSIRILKHIYNIFGYDLHKIPNCYIIYLQNILQHNITKYINIHSKLNTFLIQKFKTYQNEVSEVNKPDLDIISKLYDIDIITYNSNESMFNILKNNTHDQGFLYYLTLYNNSYVNNIQRNNLTLLQESSTIDTTQNCNIKIVKNYHTMEDFTNDNDKYVDLDYSNQNYLIEYNDLINYLQNDIESFNNNIYEEENKKRTKIEASVIIPILSNKNYLYQLLIQKNDTNIVFNKLIQMKYENKYYVRIPYKTIENDNIVIVNNIYYQFKSNKLENLNMTQEQVLKLIHENCSKKINNIEDINKHYTYLNTLNIDTHKNKIKKLISILESNNNFNNFIIRKFKKYEVHNLYFKNIKKISFKLNNIDNTLFTKYLLDYNIQTISKEKASVTELIDKINNSVYNTPYITKIKTISEKIEQSEHKKIWNYIHHYVNEYELLTNVIYNGEKYNRAYYKLWELLINNKIIDKPDFQLISLAESPGNFVKCVQNMMPLDWKNFIICTLLDDADTINQGNFFTNYKDYIFGNKHGKLKQNEEFNGDLTKKNDVNVFVNYILENNLKADLVTADGGIKKTTNEDYLLEEYNHLPLFLGEIITALSVQKIGGTFILKMYDIVYINSVNLLYLLSSVYKNVEIVKPYNSRPCNTEKYIICSDYIGFNTSDENTLIIYNKLLDILENLNASDFNYFNIFDKLVFNKTSQDKITNFNNSIVVKTQLLHSQYIYDIILNNDKKEINLIKTYFGPKRNHNLKNLLTNEENTDKGYFIKKIENCINLALYMKLKNQPLKEDYITYYKLIKNMKHSVNKTNVYPPHFKEIYLINEEENKINRVDKINKFVKKYCIIYEKPGIHKMIDYYLLRSIDDFLNEPSIVQIKNNTIINTLRKHRFKLDDLYNYLEEICKIIDIKKIFYLYNTQVISSVKYLQNTLRSYLGYYLCKYTYIPIYPKYKAIENVIDQVEKYGILFQSNYICYYSGDKLDMEEYDDFMGDTLFRSNNVSLFENTSIVSKEVKYIQNTYNNDISIEQNICCLILAKFKLDVNDKLAIVNNIKYSKHELLNDIKNSTLDNYNNFIYYISKQYDKSLLQSTKSKNTYTFNEKKYSFYKLNTTGLEEEHNIKLTSKIESIITNLNKNKEKLKVDIKLDDRHLLIQVLYELLLLKYFYDNYLNVICYTLIQIKNIVGSNHKNIYEQYIRFEKKLIENIYIQSDLFNTFKTKLLHDYLLPINLPNFNTEKTMENIISINNTTITEILENHIKITKNNWNPQRFKKSNPEKYQTSIDKLTQSKTVLDFLLNIAYIDNRRSNIYLFKLLENNTIQNTDFDKLKLPMQDYFSEEHFITMLEITDEFIQQNTNLSGVDNIISNIIHNRVELTNNSFLHYEKNHALIKPNYEPSKPIIYNSDEIYVYNCVKYLYLYVYENEGFIGFKRIFKDDICIYTEQNKTQIIQNITTLTNDELVSKYKQIYAQNYNLINHNDLVNENKLNLNDNNSLINNLCYKINKNNIDILHKFIVLYYNSLEETSEDFKNIIMRFYNDPVNHIINFMNKYKNDFISYFKSNDEYSNIITKLDNIIENVDKTYNSKDILLYDILNNSDIEKKLITIIKKNKEDLEKHNVVVVYEDLTIKDIIHIFNNIKKNVSYIANLSNNNITFDLKKKYKTIKKFYSDYEYNTVVDIIKNKNYNFNLTGFTENDYDYLQVIFNEIYDDFNYNVGNIYSTNETITKFSLIVKLQLLLIKILSKLQDTSYKFIIDPSIKYKFNYKDGKIEQNKVDSSVLSSEHITNINNKYYDLCNTLINDIIKNVSNYSSVIQKLNPSKFINDEESLEFNNTDFNDIQDSFNDGLEGDIEEQN